MKQSKLFIPTLRETPQEAVSLSHRLMLKAGMIQQMASGVYTYLPITKRVLNKIENIVREEMEAIDAAEIHMPILHPKELWEESGRWEEYGGELIRLKDRHHRDFALGPTHEEIVTALVRDELKSYKKLPLTLFQIQTKFRDEVRPRYGLLRGREFIMKDAYSFHINQESLDETYLNMFEAYTNIFKRCDLNFRAVEADSGAIGGSHTHEFMALSDIGEDVIVYSDSSEYAANIEKAECIVPTTSTDSLKDIEKVETPDVSSCESLAKVLNVDITQTTKTMVVKVDDNYVVIVLRGDQELNDVKVKSYFNAMTVELVDKETVESLMGATPGSLGPIDIQLDVYIDYQVAAMKNYPVGANDTGFHYINVNHTRDFKATTGDFRFINEGELLPNGNGVAKFLKGIEVGQVFKLGTKYSTPMNLNVLDENGRNTPVIMGCYGIGISRTLSAIIESHHDENGIIWPKSVTPFDIHLITANHKDEAIVNAADQLYNELSTTYDVLYDDRKERAGVKFADSDLIGLPIRVVVGRGVKNGVVEVKLRSSDDSEEIEFSDVLKYIQSNY